MILGNSYALQLRKRCWLACKRWCHFFLNFLAFGPFCCMFQCFCWSIPSFCPIETTHPHSGNAMLLNCLQWVVASMEKKREGVMPSKDNSIHSTSTISVATPRDNKQHSCILHNRDLHWATDNCCNWDQVQRWQLLLSPKGPQVAH